MATWQHRVVRTIHTTGDCTEEFYSIHEVHAGLDSDDPNIINAVTEHPVAPSGESLSSLRWVLNKMLESLDAPVLDAEDIMGQPMYDRNSKKA
jgi:hypothetical protein